MPIRSRRAYRAALYVALAFGLLAVFFTGGAVVPELLDYLFLGRARVTLIAAGLVSLAGQVILGVGVVRKLKSERYDQETIFVYVGLALNMVALLGIVI